MIVVPLVLAIGSATAACTDSPPPPPVPLSEPASVITTPATGATRPDPGLPAKAAVTAALLTPQELGDEYSANPGLAANNPANGLNTSLKDCAKATDDSGAVTAQQVYQGGPTGPFVVETLTETQVAPAAALMNQLRTVRQNCHQFDGEMAGGIKLNVTIDSLSLTKVADETVAYRLTATVPGAGAAFYSHLVTARSGGLVVLVSTMQMSSPDVAVTEKMIRTAMDKARRKLA